MRGSFFTSRHLTESKASETLGFTETQAKIDKYKLIQIQRAYPEWIILLEIVSPGAAVPAVMVRVSETKDGTSTEMVACQPRGLPASGGVITVI